MVPNMLEFYNMIKGYKMTTVYCGPIWADGIEGIGTTLRKRLEFDELPLSASQSVFSVFVEQMNNMLMYSAETSIFNVHDNKTIDTAIGLFVLGLQENGDYFAQSGNFMKKESVELVKSRIDYLNTLDKTELRKYYKEQIKAENTNPESRGAGLGLIEIAKRSSTKIEYDFISYNDKLVFFTMLVTITGKGGKHNGLPC